MKRIAAMSVIFFLSHSAPVSSLELKEGFIAGRDSSLRTNEERVASPIITEVVSSRHARSETGRGIGHTNLGEGSVWYRLYKNLYLYSIDVEQRKLVGSWPLSRWKGEMNPDISELYRILGARREPDVLKDEYSYQFHPG